MKAAIIAAGFGSRLWIVSNQVPKTLLDYANGSILSTIVDQMIKAGVTELYLVVGYKQHFIREYIETHPFSIPVHFVTNMEWERGNGLSVYCLKDYIPEGNFLLSMSDHIVSVDALKRMVQATETTNLLLVDPYVHEIHDIDDATKVYESEGYLVNIGKEIESYNAIDCGIFRLEQDFFTAVEAAVEQGNESISGAVNQLIRQKRFKAVRLDRPHQWLDIDTPDAYEYGRKHYEERIREGLF